MSTIAITKHKAEPWEMHRLNLEMSPNDNSAATPNDGRIHERTQTQTQTQTRTPNHQQTKQRHTRKNPNSPKETQNQNGRRSSSAKSNQERIEDVVFNRGKETTPKRGTLPPNYVPISKSDLSLSTPSTRRSKSADKCSNLPVFSNAAVIQPLTQKSHIAKYLSTRKSNDSPSRPSHEQLERVLNKEGEHLMRSWVTPTIHKAPPRANSFHPPQSRQQVMSQFNSTRSIHRPGSPTAILGRPELTPNLNIENKKDVQLMYYRRQIYLEERASQAMYQKWPEFIIESKIFGDPELRLDIESIKSASRPITASSRKSLGGTPRKGDDEDAYTVKSVGHVDELKYRISISPPGTANRTISPTNRSETTPHEDPLAESPKVHFKRYPDKEKIVRTESAQRRSRMQGAIATAESVYKQNTSGRNSPTRANPNGLKITGGHLMVESPI